MKNFAALLATVASVNAIQLGAEAEAQFGIDSFFKSDEMIPQFLGSGLFPTEDVPTGISDVIDSEDEVKIVDEVGADEDEDDDEDEDEYDDAEADDESAGESDERDAHAGINSAFANLANFNFDADVSDSELPINLDVPLVPDFEDSGDVPSLVNDIGGVTEAIKLALLSELKDQAESKEEAEEEGDDDEADADEDSDDDSEEDTPSYLIRCEGSDCELDE